MKSHRTRNTRLSHLARWSLFSAVAVAPMAWVGGAAAATPFQVFGNDARSYYPGSSSSYLGLGAGGAPWSLADITRSRGGYMFNQTTATSKRFRAVCEAGPPSAPGGCHLAGWWSTSTIRDFSITWPSTPERKAQQCNNQENFSIAVNCGVVRAL